MSDAPQPPEDVEDLIRRLNGSAEFIMASTVPLALQDAEGLKCAGTGTLFEVAGEYFIISAHHVCVVDLTNLFIPAHGNFDDRVTCKIVQVIMPFNAKEVDVAAIELANVTVFQLMNKGYRFLKLDRVDFRGPSERTLISGFPQSRYPTSGTGIMRSTTILSDQIGIPVGVDPVAQPNLDFFYQYRRTAYRIESAGTIVETNAPELNGISGASSWEMIRVVDGMWRPEKSLYITGIEIAYKFSRYARVQSWWAVTRLLCMKSNRIAKAFSERTGLKVENLTAVEGIKYPITT